MKKLITNLFFAGVFACFSASTQAQTRTEVIDASQRAVDFILDDSKRADLGSCFSCHNTGQAIRAGAMAELSLDLTVDQPQLNRLVGYINDQQYSDVPGTSYIRYWEWQFNGSWWVYTPVYATSDGRYDGAIIHEGRNPYTDGAAHPNTTTSWAMFSEIGLAGNSTLTPFNLARFIRGAAYLERIVNAQGFLPADHQDGPVDANNPGETARALMVLVKARELDGQAHWTTAINTAVNYLRGLSPRSENWYYVQDAGWIIQALTAAGAPAADPKIVAMVNLIKNSQASDGGWSLGTTASGIGSSDAFGTGVALMSLLAVGETNSSRFPAFRSGINWLLDHQTADGGWASAQGRSRVSSSTWAVLSLTALATTPPTITVPDDITIEATGPAGAVVTYSVSAVGDNGTSVPVHVSPASGSNFPLGLSTVTATATIDGESASNSFTVNVVDTTKPLITTPSNQTIEATSAAGAVASFSASATDVVSGPRPVQFSHASGTTFPITTTLVTVSAADAAGNTVSRLFGITVQDTTPPTITPHDDIVVEATSPDGASVSFSASAADLVTSSPALTFSPVSGSTFALGTTPVTITAADAHGNSSTGSFSVIVKDTIAPVIAPKAAITAEASSAAGAVITFTNPTAIDTVSGNVIVTAVPASGSTFPLGTTAVNFSATDAAGNTSSSSFTVTVQDTIAPTIAPHAPITFEATSAAGSIVTFGTPAATDAVSASVTVTATPPSGTTFPLGTTTVILTATDAAANTSTSSFVVTVQDTTAPAIAPKASMTVEATSANGAVVTFTAPGATDAVTANVNVIAVPASGSTFPLGTTEVKLTAKDGVGNTSTSSFNVTVQDTTAPAIAPKASITAEATSGAGAVVTFTAPAATDAVSGNVSVTAVPASGSTFPLGTTTVELRATDAAGNTSSSSFTITVSDTTAPLFTVAPLPSSGTLWPPNHQMVPISVTASASDAVGASLRIVRVTSSEPDNGLGDGDTAGDWQISGPLTVNLRAERAGNGSGRTYTITVEARDAAGNITEMTTSVFVPKNQGKK